jgi:hypothetical protein
VLCILRLESQLQPAKTPWPGDIKFGYDISLENNGLTIRHHDHLQFHRVACLASLLFMKRFCKTVFIHLQPNPSKPGTRCVRHLPSTNPSTTIPYGTSTNPNQKTYSSNHLPGFLQVDASPHSTPWGFVTKWVATPSGVGCLLTGC